MATKSTQQEILLLTGTSFTAGQWNKKDPSGDSLTDKEQLKEACWNGLLNEMLPEICGKKENTGALYLWQIREAAAFLELELGEFPPAIDKYYSIDPYSFLPTRLFS